MNPKKQLTILVFFVTTSIFKSQVAPVSSFSIANGGSVCVGHTLYFYDQSTNNPTSWNWQYQGPSGFGFFATQNPSLSFSTPGTYTMTLTASNGGGQGSPATQTFVVYTSPQLFISASQTFICLGDNAMLIVTGALNYTWTNTTATNDTIIVSPTAVTHYTVVGEDVYGCVGTSSIQIKVATCVGLPEDKDPQSQVMVYPNPFKEKLTIQTIEPGKISVFDITGRMILTKTAEKENTELDLTGFPSGIYLILIAEGEYGRNYRIVKE